MHRPCSNDTVYQLATSVVLTRDSTTLNVTHTKPCQPTFCVLNINRMRRHRLRLVKLPFTDY